MIETKVTIKLKDKDIVLTLAEAKIVYRELCTIFENTELCPITYPCPNVPRQDYPWTTPIITYCS